MKIGVKHEWEYKTIVCFTFLHQCLYCTFMSIVMNILSKRFEEYQRHLAFSYDVKYYHLSIFIKFSHKFKQHIKK